MTGSKSPFFAVPRSAHPTGTGSVDLPILYYDTSYVMALFFVDRAAADRAVGDRGVRPALTWRNHSVVALAGYEYRASTVGPYFEVALGIPVVPDDAPSGARWLQPLRNEEDFGRDLGYYVLHLPVTTEAANTAGRDIWGLPKFVTPIAVHHSGRRVDIRVDDPDTGEPVMTLDGRAGLGIPSPALPVVFYSHLDGHLLRSTVNGRDGNTVRAGGGVRLRVGASEHPMARTMRELGMDGLKPWALLTTHTAQSRLNRGARIDLSSPAYAG